MRQIFERCAQGWGKTRIAKHFNEAGSVAPRPQQGRPAAWSPSSVHEILNREIYRGVIVLNQTRKRNAWGQKRPQARAASEWMRTAAPQLQIVPEALWAAVHSRLADARGRYLRHTDGRLWGRPRDVESKYLLSGFARCRVCGD